MDYDDSASVVEPETYITRNVSWFFKGTKWNWKYSISKSMAFKYSNEMKRNSPANNQEYLDFLSSIIDLDNPILKDISNGLASAAKDEGYDYYETVGFFASFVQGVITYEYDSKQFNCLDYIQYPIELLVNSKGDCEDKATLLANLLAIQKYDLQLIDLEPSPDSGHIALAVNCAKSYPGYRYYIDGKDYCYLESTMSGWTLGGIPKKYEDISVYAKQVPN